MTKDAKKERQPLQPATRDHAIVLHKPCQGTQFKKKAIKVIEDFARKAMSTEEVRVDVGLNQFLWNQGIRYIPNRVRAGLNRIKAKNDEKGAFYTQVQLNRVEEFKGLRTDKNTKCE